MLVCCLLAHHHQPQGVKRAVQLLASLASTGSQQVPLINTQDGRELVDYLEAAEKALDLDDHTTYRH